ncbi:hypothetical protein SSX86_019340 [Deinandra increscens subsp. villosa]|uniref:Ubiquitin-like protease family profile domain-containing protein n=1 Tax=Deinandra increscens subsp. villosa TaxID=3103831 RepID=A0AAP0CZM1_9ASTR
MADSDSDHPRHEDHKDNSNNEESVTKSQRGPTVKSKTIKQKIVITYNKRGVPDGEGAKKLSTFEGEVARSMVNINYDSWLDVGKEIKEACWKFVLTRFVLNPKSRKHSLQSIGSKWKNFKHTLYKNFILAKKDDPEADLLTPPAMYPSVKEDDWKLFVAQRTSKKWEEKSKKAKNTRAMNKYNHRLSRKGYSGLIREIIKETGKDEEEIDRTTCWKKARELKSGGYDPNVKPIVEKIEKLEKENICDDVSCGTEDVLTQALGNDEQRGHVRGMGKYVSQQQYFHLPKTIKGYLSKEKKKMNRRLAKLEDDFERMKKGTLCSTPVSEGASCQIGNDIEDEALEEDEEHEEGAIHDKSCYLAVDVPSNIVAKGSVMNSNDLGENIDVNLETSLQGEALIPFPIEDEFIEKVKDAVGYILSWPRHLVIQFADLNNISKKKVRTKKVEVRNDAKKHEETKDASKKNEDRNNEVKKDESNDDEGRNHDKKGTQNDEEMKDASKKKRQLDPVEEQVRELLTADVQLLMGDSIIELKEKKKSKLTGKEPEQRKVMTRGERKKRVRMTSPTMLMAQMMVDGHMKHVDSIRVQCENDLFGYDSFTYLSWNDFDRVFAMDELSGAVVTSYSMYLYEQIKNGSKIDHGICFVTPTATMNHDKKGKARNVDDSSRLVADRLGSRKNNDIVLVPYNPGRHWVLGVLDMKKMKCYYLDSIRPTSVNLQFKQIVDAAIGLYNAKIGSKKASKFNWVNSAVSISVCYHCVYESLW